MGYLYNASASIVSESNKLSLSTWLRIPSIGIDTTKLIGFGEWGHNTDASRERANRFYINYVTSAGGQGNDLWYPGGFCWGMERERSPGNPSDAFLLEDSFGFSTIPYTVSSVGGMQTDRWYHYAVAFNLGEDLTHFNPSGGFNIPQVLNGVQINVTGGNAGVTQDGVTGASRPVVITGTGLRMKGNDVSVPWLNATTGTGGELWHNKIDLAYFQLWYGTYIDWTNATNFSKVVTINGSTGTPASTSGAAAAFGQQTILFSGKASNSAFFVNRGTSGSFTKVGTASDTPGPSY